MRDFRAFLGSRPRAVGPLLRPVGLSDLVCSEILRLRPLMIEVLVGLS
jgi:hypothetical protein